MSTTRAPLWTSFDAAVATDGKTSGRWCARHFHRHKDARAGRSLLALTGENRET
jgi:hypothetical protein